MASAVLLTAATGQRPRRPSTRATAPTQPSSDPDGNGWLLQEITTRLPGRIDADETAFASAEDLASAMRRASVAHGEHEKRIGGEYDANWPDWYAEYMVRSRPAGNCPPERP